MPAHQPETRDLDLVSHALKGSRDAFALLVARYSRSVRATCLARLGLREDLDDLVQETFLRAYKGLPRLEDPGRFGPYVHRIAQNICIDRLRRRGREPVPLEEVHLDPKPTPGATTDIREERLIRLRQLVGRLPESLREAVLLFYFEQKSYAEIAEQIGVTEAAINQRLHRARQQLKAAFADEPGAGGDPGPVRSEEAGR